MQRICQLFDLRWDVGTGRASQVGYDLHWNWRALNQIWFWFDHCNVTHMRSRGGTFDSFSSVCNRRFVIAACPLIQVTTACFLGRYRNFLSSTYFAPDCNDRIGNLVPKLCTSVQTTIAEWGSIMSHRQRSPILYRETVRLEADSDSQITCEIELDIDV